MGRKLTTEEYQQYLIEDDRKIQCLEEYQGSMNKIKHQCLEGHQWTVSPNSIKNGTGCPICAGVRPISTEEYHQQVVALNKGFICLEEYQTAKIKIKHQCSNGHQWKAKPLNIKTGTGCPTCATINQKITAEEYHQQVQDLDKGFTCLEEYQGALTKIKHQCSKGHQWETNPGNIKTGYGCPTCSNLRTKRDIYKDRPTWIYYIYIISLGVYKIGVALDESGGTINRYKGSKIENNYRVITEVLYQDGYQAYQLEQHLINSNQNKKWRPTQKFGGQTECFYECIQPDLIDLSQIPNLLN